MNNSLLIIDHDKAFAEVLVTYLTAEGFEVVCTHELETAFMLGVNPSFDAIILDIMITEGFDLLKALRNRVQTPVLIFSACHEDNDKIRGFTLGADDYLAKPGNLRELTARLHAILKRTHAELHPLITHRNLTVNCAARKATCNGRLLELTNTEFKLLEMLIKSPGEAFSKEALTQYALGRKHTVHDRSIDVHISNLRNKLSHEDEGTLLIKTLRGFGYLLIP